MEVKNQGVEVEVGWDHKIKDFGYRIKANIAYVTPEMMLVREGVFKMLVRFSRKYSAFKVNLPSNQRVSKQTLPTTTMRLSNKMNRYVNILI